MKNLLPFLILGFLFFSCEDVIEVDAPSEAPKLNIDALIRVDTSKTRTTVKVIAGLTSSFFDELKPAKLNQIVITNLRSETSLFLQESDPGIYVGVQNTTFFTDGELALSIEHEDQTYEARATYMEASEITKLEQGNGTLFEGNETEIIIAFTDIPNEDNYYLFDFDFNEYLVTEDDFHKGKSFEFSYFYNDDITPGMEININLLGIDEAFYNYMDLVIVQSGSSQGPFQTPVATVKGNITNITGTTNIDDVKVNTENFAFGYFAVCQSFSRSIIIE